MGAVCIFAILAGPPVLGAPFRFDDIELWVGSGEHRAALAVDWSDTSADPPALVWGFRWDGVAHGSDLLLAVLAADDRLFAKLGGTLASPSAVYGLGYDADNDTSFGVSDETQFNAFGIAVTDHSDAEFATDPADLYAEGWFTGFWHYGVAAANPFDGGTWSDPPYGMGSRVLADGGWDSWTFSPTFNFAALAENPQPAASPYAAGDFDRDGDVDAADYDRWKERYGTHDAAADGNRNGTVDAADYTVWRNHVGVNATASTSTQYSVPEPSSGVMFLLCCACYGITVRRKRESKIYGTLIRANRTLIRADFD